MWYDLHFENHSIVCKECVVEESREAGSHVKMFQLFMGAGEKVDGFSFTYKLGLKNLIWGRTLKNSTYVTNKRLS